MMPSFTKLFSNKVFNLFPIPQMTLSFHTPLDYTLSIDICCTVNKS